MVVVVVVLSLLLMVRPEMLCEVELFVLLLEPLMALFLVVTVMEALPIGHAGCQRSMA